MCRRDGARGMRVDLQFGQATEALQGSAANEPRPDVYRHVWQAFGSYVFPVGRGLQVDLGKFASNLGYETNYAKDNFNFSRAYLFNFLPYYHTGVRTSLPVSDKVTLMYMLTNGIQQAEDFNNFKSNHVTAVVKPGSAFTWITSYYAGQEQADGGEADGPDGWFRVFDTNGTIVATPELSFGFDLTHVRNQLREGDPSLAAVRRRRLRPLSADEAGRRGVALRVPGRRGAVRRHRPDAAGSHVHRGIQVLGRVPAARRVPPRFLEPAVLPVARRTRASIRTRRSSAWCGGSATRREPGNAAVGMVLLGLITFLAMYAFITLCDRV